MCDICNAAGYELEDGSAKCGAEGEVGVYLDGSGCWECAPGLEEVDAAAVLEAFGGVVNRARPGASFFKV